MINEYLRHLEFQLANSPYVDTLTVLEQEVGRVGGHIRLRGMLINGDIFEISEYVRVVQNHMEVVRYNYHWQDSSNRLIRRWDNARHHLQIRTFPHHVHAGAEDNIQASEGMSVDLFLRYLEQIAVSTKWKNER
jgi:hypothetical protein